MPAPDFPDYPELAHLVPDDNLEGIVQPRYGPSHPLAVIDRSYLKEKYSRVTGMLLVLISLSAVAFKGRFGSFGADLNRGAILLTLLVFADAVLFESFSQIMPLETLARVLPHQSYLPLAPLVFALSIFLYFLALCSADKLWVIGLSSLLIASFPLVEERSELLSEFEKSSGPSLEKFLVSPSFRLIAERGSYILKRRNLVERSTFEAAAKYLQNASFSKAGSKSAYERIADGKLNTRWSPGSGRQTGDNWLYLRFKKEELLFGLELSPGTFTSDYPRGLRVSQPTACPSELERAINPQDLRSIVDFASWQGSVAYTDQGFPYYSAQDKVEILFASMVAAECLYIEQTVAGGSF